MKTLTNFNNTELELIKINVQGFLYKEREVIFKKAILPEPSTKYTTEDLAILEPLTTTYKEFFETSIGILTSSKVQLNDKKCIACQRCTRFCPSHALEKIGVDLVLHEDRCIRCGNCLGNCPFLALKAPETGLGIYIKSLSDKPYVLPTLYTATEVEEVLFKIYSFFNGNKLPKEPLHEVIERIGFENLLNYLL